jgi:hypothetical protein
LLLSAYSFTDSTQSSIQLVFLVFRIFHLVSASLRTW